MTLGSRRFFTAFYDAISPLLKPTATPRHLPNPCHASSSSSSTRPFFTLRANTRPICTWRTTATAQIRFFGASFAPAAAWAPRSRYVVSRGFAGFCVCTNVPSTAAPTTTAAAASTVVTDGAAGVGGGLAIRRSQKKGILTRLGLRGIHIPPPRKGKRRGGGGGNGRKQPWRSKSSDSVAEKREKLKPAVVEEPIQPEARGIFERVSHIHRPTKDEMLAAATGAWQRLRIRTKWSLIRQMRPYSLEDIVAFFSWLFLGHVVWIVVGTTTFLSVAIFLVNSVFAQETLAGIVGNYLTKETGVTVVFESAIVPRWKDNCIQFKNVFVSRRPGKHGRHNVSKGSAETAAAAAAAASHIDGKDEVPHDADEEEDTNFTQFDVTIETVNVTLSIARWMNGKGLLKDVEIKGVRGVIDRTHVFWEDNLDPRSLKHVHQPGDFEIESFKLEDLLVTVYQPDGFRPFHVSIYSCDLPQLRKQWLFYDLLSANYCSGSFDDSLFTIHPRQSHIIQPGNNDEVNGLWKKTSRLRIDGLEVDHLNRGIEGPFSWIQQGNVDIIADVSFPLDDDVQFSKILHDIYGHMEATVVSSGPSENQHFSSIIASLRQIGQKDEEEKFLAMDLHVQLNDVRAAVPIFTNDLSYVNNAMIRPIVAYVNSRKTYIPIHCRVVKGLSEFEGSWTIYDSGLMDDLSAETYEAFSRNVADEQARRRRIKNVGLWSLQLLAQAFLMAMAGSVA